jgi:hypothetical protein
MTTGGAVAIALSKGTSLISTAYAVLCKETEKTVRMKMDCDAEAHQSKSRLMVNSYSSQKKMIPV